jgi:hypothetical protein
MTTRSPNGARLNRWLKWEPNARISSVLLESEPTKPSKPGSVGFEGATSAESPKVEAAPGREIDARPAVPAKLEPLEAVLNGRAVELWSTAAGTLLLVADEEDARLAVERLGSRRGEVYTAAEVRRVISVRDPAVVVEIHEWKRRFDANLQEVRMGGDETEGKGSERAAYLALNAQVRGTPTLPTGEPVTGDERKAEER